MRASGQTFRARARWCGQGARKTPPLPNLPGGCGGVRVVEVCAIDERQASAWYLHISEEMVRRDVRLTATGAA
jgi:hypothetical protein